MKLMATDGLVCPQCQSRQLERRTIYHDAIISDEVEHFKYICQECKFVFEVNYHETLL